MTRARAPSQLVQLQKKTGIQSVHDCCYLLWEPPPPPLYPEFSAGTREKAKGNRERIRGKPLEGQRAEMCLSFHLLSFYCVTSWKVKEIAIALAPGEVHTLRAFWRSLQGCPLFLTQMASGCSLRIRVVLVNDEIVGHVWRGYMLFSKGLLNNWAGRTCSEWKSDEVTALIKSLHGFSWSSAPHFPPPRWCSPDLWVVGGTVFPRVFPWLPVTPSHLQWLLGGRGVLGKGLFLLPSRCCFVFTFLSYCRSC